MTRNPIAASTAPSQISNGDHVCTADPSTATGWERAASNEGLTYDFTSDTYIFVWKRDKGFAGSCRVFEMKLSDGSTHRALFHFDK